MDQLQQARAQIDEIDAKMAALFEQRMQAVGQVAQYKARTGKQVFDPAREALVLEKNTARVQNPELQPYYREFLKKALAVSRAYQHVLIGQDVAAYQGVEGAWSHIALRQLFPFAKAQAYSTWNEVVEAVERGDAYCGVLPFENSNAGDVSAVLDLLYAHPGLKVARMCDLPIRQDLLALPGAERDQNGHQPPAGAGAEWAILETAPLCHQSLGQHSGCRPLCGGTGRPNPGSYRFRRNSQAVRAADFGRGRERGRRQHHPLYRD